MKKVLILLMSIVIIFPIVPKFQTSASAETGIEQPFSKNKTRQAIFYAVAEKGGVTFNGADNFHDALKQTDYLKHVGGNVGDGKGNKVNLADEWPKFDKEFLQKPVQLKGKPGVGVVTLSINAFLLSYGVTTTVMGIYENAKQNGENLKTLESIDSQGASFDSIGSIYTVKPEPRFGSATVMHAMIYRDGKDIGQTVHYGYGYPTGTGLSWGFQLVPYPVGTPGTEGQMEVRYWGNAIFAGDGRQHVKEGTLGSITKSTVDSITGGQVATVQNPTSLGTLNPPDWSSVPETELPQTVQIELPIDEDGYPDPERQLQPDNPATNDPKKPLIPGVTETPDYTVPEEDSGKKPVPAPNLTPKPNPQTNPLPNPSPLPDPTKTPTDPTAPVDEDMPKKKPEDTQNRWAGLVSNKFPFSLPWDIGNMIEPLLADPVRPSVKVDVSFDVFGKEVPIKFSHNFAWMDDFIGFVRIFILIGFNLFMITGTRKLMGGGQ